MVRSYLPVGLVAAYPLNEATGQNRLNSLNPAALILTQSGTVVQVAGPSATLPHGTGLLIAESQYLNLLNTSAMDFTKPWSICFWCQLVSPAAEMDLIGFATHSGSLTVCYLEGRDTGTQYFQAAILDVTQNEPQIQLAQSDLPAQGTWHHYGMSFDGSTLTLVRDGGSLVYAVTFRGPAPSGPYDWIIGNFQPGAANANANYAQLLMWQRAVSNGEFSAIYNGGNGVALPIT